MPIVAIAKNEVRQRCVACTSERALPRADLKDPALADGLPAVLRLPPCGCGGVEYLLHAPPDEPEHPSPGSHGHLHRLLVDALLEVLTRPDDDAQLDEAVAAALGPTLVARWFPDGLLANRHSTAPEGAPLPNDTTKDTP